MTYSFQYESQSEEEAVAEDEAAFKDAAGKFIEAEPNKQFSLRICILNLKIKSCKITSMSNRIGHPGQNKRYLLWKSPQQMDK